MSHTKEPWHTRGSLAGTDVVHVSTDKRGRVGCFYDEADASRAVACVNALAGIPDPAAFVARAAKLEAALEWYAQNDDTNETEGNAYWLEGRELAREALNAKETA